MADIPIGACEKCHGAGWLRGHELDDADDATRDDTMTQYKCDACPQPVGDSTSSFPDRDLTKPAEQQGLFHKFDVRRVDGSSLPGGKHHGCEYFVLDLDHDDHAPAALRAYALACSTSHPKLSADLLARYPTVSEAEVPLPEEIERIAIARYRCVPLTLSESLFGYKVVAGDGSRSLLKGSKEECYTFARKLTEAFLDGAHVACEQIVAQESDVGARVLREVFALCEDTQDKCSEDANDFTRGRRFEAKGIARAIGTWYQDEFCGRTHMGEPDLTAVYSTSIGGDL